MNVVDGDLNVRGDLIISAGGQLGVPEGAFGNTQMSATDPLDPDKITWQLVEKYWQVHGSATVTARVPFHLALGPGDIHSITAGIVVPAVGDSTVTVDLYRNGASIATPISIDSGDGAYDLLAMTIDANESDYVADAVFELVVTATAGTGTLPQGLFVFGTFHEEAQA